MAYNEKIAERIRKALADKRGVTEKKMFGGVSFMVGGKMVIGVIKDDLLVRVDPDTSAALVKKSGVRYMDYKGKPVKGFLYVSPNAAKTSAQLKGWISRGMDFVGKAKK